MAHVPPECLKSRPAGGDPTILLGASKPVAAPVYLASFRMGSQVVDAEQRRVKAVASGNPEAKTDRRLIRSSLSRLPELDVGIDPSLPRARFVRSPALEWLRQGRGLVRHRLITINPCLRCNDPRASFKSTDRKSRGEALNFAAHDGNVRDSGRLDRLLRGSGRQDAQPSNTLGIVTSLGLLAGAPPPLEFSQRFDAS